MARYTREQAEAALRAYPDLDPQYKAYIEAVRDGTLQSYYCEEFRRRRFDVSDELPNVDVRNLIDENSGRMTQYKCQGNYVLGLTTILQAAVADGVITDPPLVKGIQRFVKSDLKFQIGDPGNPARIQRINRILDATLQSLGCKLRQ